ncbi:hypothetical protein K525DRAFT_275140 [Schizophyllum commune Loenen D]|nr:hypothetical protein K525DRAFT_275140 [Schizophyllum commune Loenen D]
MSVLLEGVQTPYLPAIRKLEGHHGRRNGYRLLGPTHQKKHRWSRRIAIADADADAITRAGHQRGRRYRERQLWFAVWECALLIDYAPTTDLAIDGSGDTTSFGYGNAFISCALGQKPLVSASRLSDPVYQALFTGTVYQSQRHSFDSCVPGALSGRPAPPSRTTETDNHPSAVVEGLDGKVHRHPLPQPQYTAIGKTIYIDLLARLAHAASAAKSTSPRSLTPTPLSA